VSDQQHATDRAIEAALTAGEIEAANDPGTPPAPGATATLIKAVARQFDLEPTDVGRALFSARAATLARRAATAPPPPVAPYYRVSWSEREVAGFDVIVTAAQLADLADPDLSGPDLESDDPPPATSDPRVMHRITSRPDEFAFYDRITELNYDYADREVTEVDRFDFEITPLSVDEAHDEKHTLYRLRCWSCGARVERRGLRYVHAEDGTFAERGVPPRASDTDLAALRAAHAAGQVCPDGYVAEDKHAPYSIDELDELAAQWQSPAGRDEAAAN
jgi:hypothetical protein